MPDCNGRGCGWKGYDAEDYPRTLDKTASIAGTARELGVDESTVREQCRRHEIEVPTLGGVPGRASKAK